MFDERLLNTLYRYCYALSACPDAAYDLLHDGIERYLQARPDDREVNVAYLKKVLRNRQLDLWRRSNVVREQSLDEQVIDISSMEQQLEALTLEYEHDVAALLADVDPLEREILFLWAYEDRSAAEIAEQMALPRGTILSRMHRLKARLVRRHNTNVNGLGRASRKQR